MKLAPRSGEPLLMGILNVTPDSFFDGGRFARTDRALKQAEKMIQEGADIIDIGGESTRPGSQPVPAQEESRRVLPVIRQLARRFPKTALSIDTQKSEIAAAALQEGAGIVNDVSALTADPAMLAVVSRFKPTVILMHMRGNPKTMQRSPRYRDVAREVKSYLLARVRSLAGRGLAKDKIWLDPGIGFGKTLRHNLELLSRLKELAALRHPVCVGVSRKSFIGKILGGEKSPLPVEQRLEGSLAFALWSWLQGASVLRVHDVGSTRAVLRAWSAVRGVSA